MGRREDCADTEATRLHLGCGLEYKPGYVNVDRFEREVADVIGDTESLPFATGSADAIEAYQLIEHLDHVHCRYALSEWYRVLKLGGALIVETPDIERALAKLSKSDSQRQTDRLQWVFGLDSPGLQHKTGFTRTLLENLLRETGFESISEKTPMTHTYEPGLRMECHKPRREAHAKISALIRPAVKARLGIDDSFLLVPIETALSRALNQIDASSSRGQVSVDAMDGALADAACCCPSLALALLDEMQAQRLGGPEWTERRRVQLQSLKDIEFERRAFTSWIRMRKERGSAEEFEKFLDGCRKIVADHLRDSPGNSGCLDYLRQLDPTPVTMLDYRLAITEAGRWYGRGMKLFADGKPELAARALAISIGIHPQNYLAAWNCARARAICEGTNQEAASKYELAEMLAPDRGTKDAVRREKERAASGERPPAVPVTEQASYSEAKIVKHG